MKIAIIQPKTPYHVAGSEKVSLKHAEYLSKLGHTIEFYTSKIPPEVEQTFLYKEFLAKNIPNVNFITFDLKADIPDLYQRAPDRAHVRWVTESLAFDEKIYDTLKQNKPDIILSYYLPDSLFKPTTIPNVIYLSGYPSEPVPWYPAFIQCCDAAISISSIVTSKWTEELKHVPLFYAHGTGVDYPLPLQRKIEKKAKIDVVFAGRLIERKGVLTLIEAIEKISSRNSEIDMHTWILGEGELKEIIEERIKSAHLEEKVTVTGLVENPYDYFDMADICVYPSHQGDGLMGVVLESMAAGKPVIATKNNGNEDVITHGENGVLIEEKNLDALVLALTDLIDNPQARQKMGKAAQTYIEQYVAWEKNCEKLADIFKEIIQKFHSS